MLRANELATGLHASETELDRKLDFDRHHVRGGRAGLGAEAAAGAGSGLSQARQTRL